MDKQTPASESGWSQSTVHWHPILIVAVLVWVALGLSWAVPHRQQSDTAKRNKELRTQIASLDNQIAKEEGAAARDLSVPDPQNGMALVNGDVTFTLPAGWTRQPADSCMGGTIDADVLCRDVAKLRGTNPPAVKTVGNIETPVVEVAVYDYATTDGNAEKWINDKYLGAGGLPTYGFPKPQGMNSDDVNGNSAFTYTFVADEGGKAPDYVEAAYVVVHDKYAVLFTTKLEATKNFSDTGAAFNYRQQYSGLLKQLVTSVKFKGQS